MKKILKPENWALEINSNGELAVNGISTISLASDYGTPLHVLNEVRLRKTAEQFKDSMQKTYTGRVSVHYAFKCNSVPYIIELIKRSGLNAEVMTVYELELALRIGFTGDQIIVNGPVKTEKFLIQCISNHVRFIIIDSLEELFLVNRIAEQKGKLADVLLRINPDYIPRGMNSGTATGSRKGCAFGLDLRTSEPQKALQILPSLKNIKFSGFHFHIGTGIKYPQEYSNTIKKLEQLFYYTLQTGFDINVLDVGGGIASFTTRELTTFELLAYQSAGIFPSRIGKINQLKFDDFGKEISNAVLKIFSAVNLPEIIYEPGRCITSSNQFLLLSVNRIKNRNGIGKWVITDGGLGTVTMPTYYEYHEVFLCNDVNRKQLEKVSIIGPCCFAADIVYKNKILPKLMEGEIIALMDSGAYFTALESSFGFPRPAIVSVENGFHHLVRRRESYDDMISRDQPIIKHLKES